MRKTGGNTNDPLVAEPVVDDAADGAAGADPADEIGDDEDSLFGADERISELQRELTTEKDKHLRLAAEFDNFRKRMVKERAEAEARGQSELARLLLEPLDDISRFADLDPAATDAATIVQGVDMVEKKLEKALRSAGLEPINPQGVRFDPALHEAVATEPAPTADLDGTVSQVYQVGYSFKGQLLRPARVVVRQYPGSH